VSRKKDRDKDSRRNNERDIGYFNSANGFEGMWDEPDESAEPVKS